ncbi:TonB-dependent receptor [Myroides sp. LJL116]
MRVTLLVSSLVFSINVFAQDFSLKGTVKDTYGHVLPGAKVSFGTNSTWANEKGEYNFLFQEEAQDSLKVELIGFSSVSDFVKVDKPIYKQIVLDLEQYFLEDIVISAAYENPHLGNIQDFRVNKLQKNYQGSLAKSLDNIAGMNSMDIGAGASKPTIRGLGFNRLVVAQNGSKQEGQQWGADHGLEIDMFANEKISIIKGVGTILYGSDAISGVVQVDNEQIPEQDSFSGNFHVLTQSVNDSYGGVLQLKGRGEKTFFKFNVSAFDYADYKVPTNQILYLDTKIPLKNNRVVNSAGRSLALSGQIGYVEKKWENILTVSNFYEKSGFFPGSHAMDEMDLDKSGKGSRYIAMPNQSVNHFKVVNNWRYFLSDNTTLKVMGSFQNNLRQEKNEFHSHSGGQLDPKSDPNLEVEFNLSTIETSIVVENISAENHQVKLGASYLYQDNTIGGYGFLLPKYRKDNIGLFATYSYHLNPKVTLEGGVRFDIASIDTDSFFDQSLYDYLLQQGYNEQTALQYGQRSQDFSKTYSSFNAMLGLNYKWTQSTALAMTLGSTFRFPTPMELSSNGVHHGAYRFEKGSLDLDPERGFVVDMNVKVERQKFAIGFSPFLYYFTNYIYLRPSGEFSVVPDSGQIYQYSQTKAILSGFELELEVNLFKNIRLTNILEYNYTQQITKDKKTNYPLAFSIPLNNFTQVEYSLKDLHSFKNNSWFFNAKWFARQNRIAQAELPTPSTLSLTTGVNSKITLGELDLNTSVSISNLLNRKNLSHTSFYRTLDIPQPGRSIQVNVSIPF